MFAYFSAHRAQNFVLLFLIFFNKRRDVFVKTLSAVFYVSDKRRSASVQLFTGLLDLCLKFCLKLQYLCLQCLNLRLTCLHKLITHLHDLLQTDLILHHRFDVTLF